MSTERHLNEKIADPKTTIESKSVLECWFGHPANLPRRVVCVSSTSGFLTYSVLDTQNPGCYWLHRWFQVMFWKDKRTRIRLVDSHRSLNVYFPIFQSGSSKIVQFCDCVP